ncbi:Riboflavin biosynthesis protein RibF [Thalassoglobus neptunius]|uniref:Riboflavin biosynthesis protein n=1 Tax=Thalassoglobus neptunius TaxID=1938619 RepID=A0A5C5X7L4_9PLAN|nr:bifunctional riboflavin kinase/FAD synthetase [Thalassoglobus neptunius]TWT58659.1 Riboflavin biosynthesis protein RibF [Thalassoglobus neptunius]
MTLFRGFADSHPACGGFVSIGNFDGVHLGHQQLLKALIEQAREASLPSVVMTFEPHPIRLLRPDQEPPRLSTLEEKSRLIHECGVDHVIAYPTDMGLLSLTPDEFFRRVILEQLNARGMVEGPNFFYGKMRTGSIETLRAECQQHSIELLVIQPELLGEKMVSSSSIRKSLASGEIVDANFQLGRPYQLQGRVTHGEQRGRQIGFPTANLTEIETIIPGEGVYACVATTEDGDFPAAVSVGRNPTFSGDEKKVEAHLIGFQKDLYSSMLTLKFLDRLRGQVTFEGREQLEEQIRNDVAATKEVVCKTLGD